MWTAENRPRYNRDKLRYPSDLTGEEWAHDLAAYPAGQAGRRQAARGFARGGQRRDVRFEHRLPVALSSQRPAAQEHRA